MATDEIEGEDFEVGARSFTRLLEKIGDGDLVGELSEKTRKLAVLVEGLAETQGQSSGEITLKLKLKCDLKGTFTISGDIAVKEPKPVRADSRMWLDKNGNLNETNSRQPNLPIRDVSLTGKARTV